MIKRNKTRVIEIGPVKVGGSYPVAVQSMTNTETADLKTTLAQIRRLRNWGTILGRLPRTANWQSSQRQIWGRAISG